MAVKKPNFDIVEYEFRQGTTLNIGDFEGVRFDIGVKVTTSKANVETTKMVIRQMVEEDLDKCATDFIKEIELPAKCGQLARLYKERANASK